MLELVLELVLELIPTWTVQHVVLVIAIRPRAGSLLTIN